MGMDENSAMEDDNNQQIVDFETAQPAPDSGNVETAEFELFDGKDDDFATMLMCKGTDLSGCLLGIKARKWEHIFSLYKKHSQLKDFSIKKSTSRRADVKDRPLIEIYFRCSCEGVHANGNEVSSRNAAITRCKYEACVRTKVNVDGLWEVVQHVLEHNHPFTPVQWQHHHRSERKITEAEDQFRVAAAGAGGDAFVGHTKRDHINYVNRLKMKTIEGGDAATLINLMTSRQAEEPGFFFRVQFDEKGRLSNLFWRDAMMRDDYLLYGDVKIFDTTYRTNRFIHKPDIVYVSGTFNKTHFGKLKGDRPFQNLFNKCLHGYYNEAEFEQTWHKMLSDYGLVNHSWFKRLYKHRAKWSTAFNNQFFSAGILSSQRSESTNHAMGFQASKTTSVTEFFGIFENTVKRWRGEEERKEFNGIRSTPSSVYPLVDLLLHASQVYTLELFRVFEKEFALAMGTRAVILLIDDPEVLLYRVYPAAHEEDNHHVTYDCKNNLTECTCRNFQVNGMLCSHIIRVFHMHSVVEIPERYILCRWTKFSKTIVWERFLPSDIRRNAAHNAINWRRSMLTAMNYLITKSQSVSDARTVVDKLFIKANEEVELLLSKLNMEEDEPTVDVSVPPILDPVRCTTKGRSQRKKRNMGTRKKAKKGSELGAGESTMYVAVPRLI
ncbi:protein FAR1-RELATED SEQUENCE 5-like [Silene latifolia]|uniref:protein FAR1-RELATED SEQUENCE 5-like n=1 Tax=Silene latifolia TaxID=37657 RepID=UPI003D76D14A